MLISTDKHTPADLARWDVLERTARLHARTAAHRRRVAEAVAAIAEFADAPCYAGTSWGKDSVVLAGLIAEYAPHVPLVWVRVEPRTNPECPLVRDSFLAAYRGVKYEEIETWSEYVDGSWVTHGLTSGEGFRLAAERHGRRHISGVRGDESAIRRLRVAVHGLASAHACAPLGRWSGLDVFAYLLSHDLPIHPAYAYTMGGHLDPIRIRVASLDGERGTGWGRREWEWMYYREDVTRARRQKAPHVPA